MPSRTRVFCSRRRSRQIHWSSWGLSAVFSWQSCWILSMFYSFIHFTFAQWSSWSFFNVSFDSEWSSSWWLLRRNVPEPRVTTLNGTFYPADSAKLALSAPEHRNLCNSTPYKKLYFLCPHFGFEWVCLFRTRSVVPSSGASHCCF